MVASFTQLYVVVLGPFAVSARASLAVGLAALALGSWVYLGSRRAYRAVGLTWRPRWHTAAAIVAGSGAGFWLLFGLLAILVRLGVPVT